MWDVRRQCIKTFKIACAVFLSSVICFPASAAQADDAGVLANQDSVEVPAKSQHVVLDAAFISPGGHLVLQTDGLDDGKLRVNYYDAQTGSWLLPSALTSLQDVAAELNRLTEGGFRKLDHMPTITLANGTRIYNFIDLKGICFRPYADFLEIAPPGSSPIENAIYLKMKTPETVYAADDKSQAPRPLAQSHSCPAAKSKNATLTANYEQESPFFFSDAAGGFFMLVSRYAIHFDSSGNSNFFKGQGNPVLLSANDTEVLRGILATANKGQNPQDAIDHAEALITHASQTQAQEATQ